MDSGKGFYVYRALANLYRFSHVFHLLTRYMLSFRPTTLTMGAQTPSQDPASPTTLLSAVLANSLTISTRCENCGNFLDNVAQASSIPQRCSSDSVRNRPWFTLAVSEDTSVRCGVCSKMDGRSITQLSEESTSGEFSTHGI